MRTTSRRATLVGSLLTAGVVATAAPLALAAPTPDRVAAVGQLDLLTDPFLQLPQRSSVNVVWFTEFEGDAHWILTGRRVDTLTEDQIRRALTGRKVPGVTLHGAATTRLSRAAEDPGSQLPADRKPAAGIERRPVFRHEGTVTNVPRDGRRHPYRVVSVSDGQLAVSATYGLRGALKPGADATIMLTSDHQAMVNTPANLELAAATIGDIDAVFFAGDLVNIPDRASEWFDDQRGSAFFPVLQGNGNRAGTNGRTYRGAEIIQNAPVYPAIGNHEVQGRIDGATSLNQSYNNPVPRDVAAAQYELVADLVNPAGDEAVREQWIEDNSFSTTTYEEIFSLPESSSGGERYYATTVGDVRLVSLFSTRIWRPTNANADPAVRTATSRYQEAAANLDRPLQQGHGTFLFEAIGVGSEQYEWLRAELASPEFRDAEHTVVMLHEGPQGLGDNAMPHFGDPVRVEERDAAGNLVGIRYEYPEDGNVLLHDLQPLLEAASVDLVYNGHSHLWNRFESPNGVNYLEASNTGNSYGAYHPLSGRSRPVPPAPWDASNYLAQGNPGGLEPVVPSQNPLTNAAGAPTPFVASNDLVVFQALDTGTGEVTSWYVDMRNPDAGAVVLDRFRLDD